MHNKRKKVIAVTEIGRVVAKKISKWQEYKIVYRTNDQNIRLNTWNYSCDILCVLSGLYDEVLWNLPLREFVPQFCEEFGCGSDKAYIYKSLTYLEQRCLIHTKELEL